MYFDIINNKNNNYNKSSNIEQDEFVTINGSHIHKIFYRLFILGTFLITMLYEKLKNCYPSSPKDRQTRNFTLLHLLLCFRLSHMFLMVTLHQL